MLSLLLAIIYISFISLGLPDSLLGAGWPAMREQMLVPVSYAGIVSMLIAGGTIISSLLSERFTKKFGAGLVTAASVLLTAAAMLGFSCSRHFWLLCVLAVPYGLGAGAVDAALNNYVALHYSSRHMNWLHCFWGLGATISPYIMGYALSNGSGWNSGYRTVAIVQFGLTAVLFLSLGMWKKREAGAEEHTGALKLSRIVSIRGVKYVLIAFFAYCAFESTAGLWASSYLVLQRGIAPETAARCASFFYLGITVGRFASGFIANRIGDRRMIKLGIAVTIAGVAAISVPIDVVCLCGLVVAGLGCAPVYPAIIHSTPVNFGAQNSQAVVGVQMASAYAGSTFIPPVFGWLANHTGVAPFPFFLLAFTFLMLIMTALLNSRCI